MPKDYFYIFITNLMTVLFSLEAVTVAYYIFYNRPLEIAVHFKVKYCNKSEPLQKLWVPGTSVFLVVIIYTFYMFTLFR